MDEVAPDHFLHQFDRYGDDAAKLKHMAQHAAYLLNRVIEERNKRLEMLERVVDRLCSGDAPAKIAIEFEREHAEETDHM